MKLETGKTYRRRDGGLESIVFVDTVNAYNPSDSVWYIDGKKSHMEPTQFDLIEEVPLSVHEFSETAEAGLSVVRDNDTECELAAWELLANCRKQLAKMTEQRDAARSGWEQLYNTIRACGCPCGTPIAPSIEHELTHFAKARAKWITAAKGASHE